MWKTERAVAGLSFHPSECVLAVATVNEVYFWDWSQPEPFTKVKTRHEQERVRFVQFDHIGHHLVTGIMNYTPPNPPTPERSRESSPSRAAVTALESGRFRPPLRHVDDPGFGGGGLLSAHDVLFMHRRRRHLPFSDSDSSPNQSPVSLVNLSRRRADRDEAWSTTASIGSRGSPPPSATPSDPVPRSALAGPALTNSASQTLSDLAQAASNQLIAENERLLSGRTGAQSMLDSSFDRDDPLLSDRPYGQSLPTRTRPASQSRILTEPSQIRTHLLPSGAGQRSSRIDHNYVMRSNRFGGSGTSAHLSSGRELDLRMTFSHSPESEFVEVARPPPLGVRNPSLASLEPDAPSRVLSQRERRLETLLDERRALVHEIQQMRTTREILFPSPDEPAPGNIPTPIRLPFGPTSRDSSTQPGQDDLSRAGIAARSLNERSRRPPPPPFLPLRLPIYSANSTGGGSSESGGIASSTVTATTVSPSEVGPNARSSSLASPRSISMTADTRDHIFGNSRPIDEWAVNQRLAIESSRLAQSLSSELGTEASDVLRLSNEGNNVSNTTATVLTSNATNPPDPVERLSLDVQLELLRSRRRERLLRMSLRRGALNELNRIYDDDGSPTVLNESDAVRAAEPTVETLPPSSEVPPLAEHQTTASAREAVADPSIDGPDESDTGRSGSQSLDIALLSRHIDHMQRICRESLSGIIPRQRRQILRLQSIRRMLEDLQVQIRNLRAASIQELQRRQDRLSSDLQAKQRISLALSRLGNAARRSPRLPATARGAANLGTRRPNPSDLEAAVGNSSSTYRNRSLGQLRKSLSRSSTLRARAQCQVASQMRASLRAVQLGPDLARQANSPLSQIKAQASLNVLEQTSKNAGSLLPNSPQVSSDMSAVHIEPVDVLEPVTNTDSVDLDARVVQDSRSELRAFSQRLERLLRAQRETAEQGRRGSRDFEDHDLEDDPANVDDGDPLLGLPRPTTYMSYRQRFRHLFDGTSEYSSLLDHDPESQDRGTTDRGNGDGFFASSSESESDSDPSLSSFYGLPYTGNNLDNRIRMEHMGLSRRGPTSRTFRNSLRDWSDARVGLRRHEERERRRLSRERDLIRRRHRYGRYFADSEFFPGTNEPQTLPRTHRDPLMNQMNQQPHMSSTRNVTNAGDSENANTVSPLREQIWRRLRRRNAQLNQLDSQIMAETGSRDRSRHREFLSGLVDQLTIDQPQFSSAFHPNNDVDHPRGSANDNIPIANNDSLSIAMNSTQRPTPSSYTDSNNGRASSPGGRLRGLPDQLRYRNYSHMLILGRRDAAGIGPFSLRIEDGIETGHMLATNRIQAWNFSRGQLPDISDTTSNIVVKEACIVSSASVDISEDNTLLVTLTPTYAPMTTAVGVYSLKTESRGQCLASLSVESSVVSVSLSPTSRHLLVGLNRQTRRLPSSGAERGLMAHVYRIQFPWERDSERGRLIHKRDIAQLETSALNCIRWIPTPGQGMAYATNTGLIKLLR
ncbi:hypothetical protein TCAL_13663 [Tigriopus californicus]|uniref:Activating molecule in BECN1-regulated autophagy protein 1 n=2 Tax=Tigriopus californicus TaxID=6832 RepID=A0A553PHY4_TIGCA|nr:hypothetical protein TCAL_13663 [Tigriopus californicus]